jgi:hypothetical protein
MALLQATEPSPNALTRLHFCTALSAPPKGAGPTACLWKKTTLTVRFLEGDPVVQDKVRQTALEWNKYSGVQLRFTDSGDADIRIGFRPDGGSNSYVGTCRPALGPSDETMNLGWLTPTTSDEEYRRVVLHEFGHALGLIHEHQSPASPIQWNKQAAYDYYASTNHWDHATVDHNLFQKYAAGETHSAFDPTSIMAYYIPKELTTDGVAIGTWNSKLSDTDKNFIARLYPR